MLEHLARPHNIEARIAQRPGPVQLDALQLELGMTHPRAAQGLLGDIDPRDVGPMVDELGGKATVPAAHVQDARARAHAIEQKASPHSEALGLEILGQALPEGLVVVAGGHLCAG